MKRQRINFKILLPWALVVLLLALVLWFVATAGPGSILTERYNADCFKQFPLTSNTLDCITYEDSSARLRALDATLEQASALYVKEGRATRVSVWVRNFTSKQYASANEFETYAPASLLKLPLAIAYYKFSEIQPEMMNTVVIYTVPPELDERLNYFTATSSLVAGKSYSMEELLARMITSSDNGAYFTLLHHVDNDFYNRVLLELGIQIPSNDGVIDFVTVKTYGNIFRILYNASYLNRTDSERLLNLMTTSDFKDIAEPLSSTVTVADKFGERSVFDQNGNSLLRELHDCGIVYKDPDPYSVCIMTEGADMQQLYSVIRDLSKIVYQNI